MGSAIGLGNFLRFPGLAAKYDGGAFMIPYFIALLFLGLPIAWTEWAIGRYGGRQGFSSSPGIFRAIWNNRVSPYLGILGLIVPVGIYMYYVFIEAWCLYYAIQYLTGGLDLGRDPSVYTAFFTDFTGQARDGIHFERGFSPAVWTLLIVFVVNFGIIYRGLSKGIEYVCKFGIPILFACALVVLIRVLTLGTPDPALPDQNVLNGLGFMWNPSTEKASIWESLSNAEMWMQAAGQIFFSLSVGFGVIITYASYLKPKDDITLSGVTSVSGNEFAEVALGGMITIPAAFIFLGAAGAVGSTFQLGFVTLPVVFAYMPFGSVFGFLWFFLLFIAAITSSLSMLQPAIAFFEEGLGVGRKASITILGFVTIIGALFIVYFSKGLSALDNMDFWVGTLCIFLLAAAEVMIGAWAFGAKNVIHELQQGSAIKVPKILPFLIKFVAPSYLLIVFVFWLYQNLSSYVAKIQSDDVARFTVLFILLFIIFFVFLTYSAVKRWTRLEGKQ